MEQHLQKILLHQPQQNKHSSFLLSADYSVIISDSENNLQGGVFT